MDRKTGLPPSGSTMGNNALRIKNKLFAASTMTNLQPHSPAPNHAAQDCVMQHGLLSRREPANAAHIITLNRQNTLSVVDVVGTMVPASTPQQRLSGNLARAANTKVSGIEVLASTPRWQLPETLTRPTDLQVFGTKGWVSTMRWRLSGILKRASDQRAFHAMNRASHRPFLEHASALRPGKRSCPSLRSDVARRKSARFRCEPVTLRCFQPEPLRAQRLAHTPASHHQTALQPRAGRPRQLPLLARMRAHPPRQVFACWLGRF